MELEYRLKIEEAVDHLFVFFPGKRLKRMTVLEAIIDYTNDSNSTHFRQVVRKVLSNRNIYQLKEEHRRVYTNINFKH